MAKAKTMRPDRRASKEAGQPAKVGASKQPKFLPIGPRAFYIKGPDPLTSYLCDPDVELAHGQHVALVPEGELYATGTLVTKHPKKAKSLTIQHDGSGGRIGGCRKTSLVCIVGKLTATQW